MTHLNLVSFVCVHPGEHVGAKSGEMYCIPCQAHGIPKQKKIDLVLSKVGVNSPGEAIVFDDSAVLAVHPTTVASVVDLGGVVAVGDHLGDARDGDVLEQEAGGARPGGGGRGSDDDYSSDCGKRRVEH